MIQNKSFSSGQPLRIAVLDDHPLILKALQYGIEDEQDLVIAGLCANRRELTPLLEENSVDVLVLDYLLTDEDLDGLLLVKHLRNSYPKLKILVSTTLESPAIVQLVMKAGVLGFIGKTSDQDELLRAIRKVGSGQRFITSSMQFELDKLQEPSKEMHGYMAPRPEGDDIAVMVRQLSPREVEVIRCYLDGLTIAQIAAKYSRSRKTISGQKQTALRKLGLRSDVELFKFKDLI